MFLEIKKDDHDREVKRNENEKEGSSPDFVFFSAFCSKT
jgi:hypothetical protein